MGNTAVGDDPLNTELILDRARELLIRSLYKTGEDVDLHDEIEIWLEDYWSKYGKNASRGTGRE